MPSVNCDRISRSLKQSFPCRKPLRKEVRLSWPKHADHHRGKVFCYICTYHVMQTLRFICLDFSVAWIVWLRLSFVTSISCSIFLYRSALALEWRKSVTIVAKKKQTKKREQIEGSFCPIYNFSQTDCLGEKFIARTNPTKVRRALVDERGEEN